MIFNDSRRLRKTLSLAEKLDILGVDLPTLEAFLFVIGANVIQPPYAIWHYDERAEALGADGFGLEGWQRRERFSPGVTGVLDHFLHRKKVIAVRREFVGNWRNSKICVAIAFDVDAHDESQRLTIAHRLAFLRAILPYPHFEFVNARNESRQVIFPLHECVADRPFELQLFGREKGHLGIVYSVQTADPQGVVWDADGTPHTHESFHRNDFDEIFQIRRLLAKLGFDKPEIEVWPWEERPLRLPAGPDNFLLHEGFPVEHPGTIIQTVVDVVRGLDPASLPMLTRVRDDLQRIVNAGNLRWRPVLKATKRPQRQSALIVQPNVRDAEGNLLSPGVLLMHGLPGPGTRADACMALIRYWAPECGDHEELGAKVWEWLVMHNNGLSSLYNTRPDRAEKWIHAAAKSWVGKLRSGMATTPVRRTGHDLRRGDLVKILQIVPQPATRRRSRSSYWATVAFMAAFLRYVKGKGAASADGLTHTVDIPVASWTRFPGSTNKPDKPSYYMHRIDFLRRVGILADGRTAYWTGRCRSYIVHFEFDQVGDEIEDAESWLKTAVDEFSCAVAMSPATRFLVPLG